MYQVDDPTAAASFPTPAAPGTAGYFTDGNPGSGVAATILRADFMNAVMLELMNVVSAAGITLSKTAQNQILLSIKRLVQSQVVLTDTGAVNAYAAANTPALVGGASPTWVNGVVQQLVVGHTNTGPSTYAPDGLPAIPIYGLGLQALQGGEMFVGGTAILMKQTIAGVNSGNPIAVLLECAGGAQQIPPGTQSGHAAQLSQAGFQHQNIYKLIAGVLNVSVDGGAFTTTGASNFVTPPSGRWKGRVWGGGGGSGGTFGNPSASQGGAGAGYAELTVTGQTPGTSNAITVGAGGTAGVGGSSPTNGGTGGTSSIGALMSATGGVGGSAANGGVATSTPAGGTGAGGALNVTGGSPNGTLNVSGTVVSQSGGAPYGMPQMYFHVSSSSDPGVAGANFGVGASGSLQQANGAKGGDGLIIIEY
jgi:hypothetical protein